MILRGTRDVLPCHAEAAVPPWDGPQFDSQGNAPPRELFRQELAAHGLLSNAFAEEGWQGAVKELSSHLEMRQAKQDAHVQHMRQQLVQARDILRNEERAQAQASHRAETAAAAGAPLELLAHSTWELARSQRNLQERKKVLELENGEAGLRARTAVPLQVR